MKSHTVFFSNSFFLIFFNDLRSWCRNAFLVILHYGLNHWLQCESCLKLIMKLCGKKGDKTDILKLQKKFNLVIVFQQFKKPDKSCFFENFWMNVWGNTIAHIYSVANIAITFTPKISHSPIFQFFSLKEMLRLWSI